MKKIIVPTDFSFAAKDALNVAMEIAPILKSSLNVVHIYSGSINPNQPMVIKAGKGHYESLIDDLQSFIFLDGPNGEVMVRPKVKVEYDAIVGFTERELVNLSKFPDTDLIVMGNTGSHGISGKLFGTTATGVSRHAHCPVLLVPKGHKFEGFKNILFASDFEGANKEVLKRLINIAKLFQATVHFIHIEKEGTKSDSVEIENRVFDLLFEKGEPEIAFHMKTIRSESVVNTLNNYALENDIDLTVMVSPHRSFFQDFLHKSKTKSMALNTKLPMLVLHTDD